MSKFKFEVGAKVISEVPWLPLSIGTIVRRSYRNDVPVYDVSIHSGNSTNHTMLFGENEMRTPTKMEARCAHSGTLRGQKRRKMQLEKKIQDIRKFVRVRKTGIYYRGFRIADLPPRT